MDLQEIMHSPFMIGAVSGLVSAAAVDYDAFRKWKTINEAANYDWKVAIWRWFQGFVSGGLGATLFFKA